MFTKKMNVTCNDIVRCEGLEKNKKYEILEVIEVPELEDTLLILKDAPKVQGKHSAYSIDFFEVAQD